MPARKYSVEQVVAKWLRLLRIGGNPMSPQQLVSELVVLTRFSGHLDRPRLRGADPFGAEVPGPAGVAAHPIRADRVARRF